MYFEFYLFCVLLGGVFISIMHGPKGVLGFVLVFPERQLVVPPSGEHARRLDFLVDRFRNKSLRKIIECKFHHGHIKKNSF